MATLDRLVAQKVITEVTVPMGRTEFPERRIYAYPGPLLWMQNDVPNMVSGRLRADMKPREQLLVFLRKWILGRPIRYVASFKDMDPMRDEVWEAKTPDLRLFGWMPQPRKFIVVLGGYADDYKPPNPKLSYETARRTVIAARDALDLDEPKIAKGSFDELVSV